MSELIIEIGSKGKKEEVPNLGGRDQFIEGAVVTGALCPEDFSFPNIEGVSSKTVWLDAIKNKDIKPLPYFEELSDDNTEATLKEKRRGTKTIKKGVAGSKYKFDASMLTYEGLKNIEGSKYTRFIEITDEEEITVDKQSDGTIKGRKMSSFIVPVRNRTSLEDDANVEVAIKFEKDTYSILRPGFEVSKLEGVRDVILEIVSASATEIKFTAKTNCTGDNVASMQTGNFKVRKADGSAHSFASFTEADDNDIYVITGVGFATDYTLEVDGVVLQGDSTYEGVAPVKITI